MLKTIIFFFLAVIHNGFCAAQNDFSVAIREFDVPTAAARPHDPAIAPDGSLWYTGQDANNLGRLDPETGQIKEFLLSTPNSGPHGFVADKEGNIWFTANSAACGRILIYRLMLMQHQREIELPLKAHPDCPYFGYEKKSRFLGAAWQCI